MSRQLSGQATHVEHDLGPARKSSNDCVTLASIRCERKQSCERKVCPCHATGVRIGFYAPYLAALGGGEKYILVILSEALALPGADVRLLSPEPPQTKAWERLNVAVDPDDPRLTWLLARDDVAATELTRELDLFVTLHNAVPPLSFSRRSIGIIQFPFRPGLVGRALALRRPFAMIRRRRDERRRLDSYDEFVCYSDFVRKHLVRRWRVANTRVIHPPVDVPSEPSTGPRLPHIAAVGRFFRSGHSKKQDVLIRAFRRLWEQRDRPDDLHLHLVGGAEGPEGGAFLEELRLLAAGLPVSFHVGASAEALTRLYERSSLFWHATGQSESERRHPDRMEHFGIAPVEAMAHGCIVLTVPKGGQKEIVVDGANGLFWETIDELVERSQEVLRDEPRFEPIRLAAIGAARRYSTDHFRAVIRETVLLSAQDDVAAAPGRG
jgi:glycosyltransferase involved in cell wall biosynthesis